MAATGVTSGSAAFATPVGIELPITINAVVGTTVILAAPAPTAAGSNRKRIQAIRLCVVTAAATPTCKVQKVTNAGGTYLIRNASAMAADEVYRDLDILLLPGDRIEAVVTGSQVDITGTYVDIGRGSSTP